MASLVDCITKAVAQKRISQNLANQIVNSPDPDYAFKLAQLTMTIQRREAILSAIRMNNVLLDIKTHPKGMAAGLAAAMVKDNFGLARYTNVDYQAEIYKKKYLSRLPEMLSRFRTRMLGLSQDTKGLEDLVEALYGKVSNDASINGFAKDLSKLFEDMRKDFNIKGGYIPKNQNWKMPPPGHNRRAVEKAGLAQWKGFILDKLDRNLMVDNLGNRLSDPDLDQALDYVYKTITTDGLHKLKELTVNPVLGKKLSRRHSERRFLHFKDGKSWLEYHGRFGHGDVLTTITSHIESLSHEMALIEKFGPNPTAAFGALFNEIKKAGEDTKVFGGLEWIFKVINGDVNQVENVTRADFMQTGRNLLTASTLHSAFLSALSDPLFNVITAKYNGLPAVKILARQLSLLNPANEADRIFAAKIGLISDAWVQHATGANRYADVLGVGPSAKTAEVVMRASLLQPWTDAGRKAFGMEFSSLLADNFSKAFDDLEWHLKRAFESYDISSSDWDTLRRQTPLDHKGAKFADLVQPEAEKFHRMVLTETDYAIPTPDSRVRAIQTAGMQRGSIPGEAWRSAMMLKSFTATIASTHLYRGAMQQGMLSKTSYYAQLFIGGMIMGGVALQAKDIAAGREPRPIDAKFIPAAIAQGGGFGILGDFIFSDVNRFGGGPASTIMGPTGELVDKTLSLTLGNIQQAIAGEETNVLGESVQYVKRYTPSVWEINLIKNAIFDGLAGMVDPIGERKRHKRIMQKREKDFDQGFWWAPGEPLPEFAQ